MSVSAVVLSVLLSMIRRSASAGSTGKCYEHRLCRLDARLGGATFAANGSWSLNLVALLHLPSFLL
jgi:hypothetical protein